MSNTNITEFNSGLNLDVSPVNQPKGTQRFNLNTVNESESGDKGTRGIEEANEECSSLTPGYIPIGKCYIGNNQTVIFSVSEDNTISEIGIQDDNCNYTVHVNDKDSIGKDKLGFKVERQISATYRLRRGCERTIYFVGEGYPNRYFNFDKPNQFKDGGLWSASKFKLQKRIEVFPTIDKIEVLDNDGNLIPGSYTILVQHLDEDLNGTEFYELVKNIKIYNDSLNKTFSDIQGSSNIGDDESPYKYSKTTKAIKVVLDAVDMNFTYVRFAFVETNNGTGRPNDIVKYSAPISVHSPVFTYTGNNASSEGTLQEVELFNIGSGLDSAEHIDQIDNMLILANVMGEQADICKLQKYASRIKTDCFVKDIILTSVEEQHNSKNPLQDYNGIGYQPGDIVSPGIIWVFEDYSLSPVCHIPGKSNLISKDIVYSPGINVYPMSNENNQNQSETYIDENTSCPTNDFWGLDSEGNPLKNKNVRHHRFPTRDEIGVGFVKRKETTGGIALFKRLQLAITEVPRKSTDLYVAEDYIIKVKYKRNGIEESFNDTIYPDSNIPLGTVNSNIFQDNVNITDIRLIYIQLGTTTEIEIPLVNNESEIQSNGAKYKISILEIKENNTKHIYEVPIFGLKFSDIQFPPEDEIGKKVIGYQIVRQERTEDDKTILDSAVVFPMMKSGRNVSTAMLAPEFWTNRFGPESTCEGSEDNIYPTCYNVSKRNLMLVTPSHKFMDKTFDGFTSIEQVGTFEKEYVGRSATLTQNIYEGTSASGDEDKETRDDDGFSLKHGYRFTGVKYSKTSGTPLKVTNEDTRMYNLQAVNYAEAEDNKETLYNIACDNKALVLSSNKEGIDLRTYRPGKHHFPYVYIKRNNTTFYQNFRNNPYYLASTEVFTESSCQVFGGDTHIVPMRHSNHIFGNAVAAMRRKKLSAWVWIGSAIIAIIGVALSIISGSTSLILAGGILIAIGAVATLTAAIIEVQKFNEIYGDKWEANLDRTVFDYFYARLFIREDPHKMTDDKDWEISQFYQAWQDDTFKWFGDTIGDLWFETQLNISLRVQPTSVENNYLLPLKEYMPDRQDKWSAATNVEWVKVNGILNGSGFHRYTDNTIDADMSDEWYFIKKITKPNSAKPSGLEYLGMSIPQIYLINPDYNTTNGIKRFYTIPLEYDCCSECRECFPHRIHYSEQSFQEEKTDNYRMFLPNNYRDIEGETGEITNIFRFYNNLYAHTEEALWQMGRKYEERVTDNIVSFIGSGEYFETPPQKVLDDDTGSSAGTRHKWGMIKTPEGVFFPSENQKRIYQFTGKDLKPISEIGVSNWVKNNIEVNIDRQFLKEKGYEYPNRNNPSSLIGSGFISTYDSRKERIIFTKKDLKLNDDLFEGDKEFCINGNNITVFNNITNTITGYVQQGWIYSGVEECKLKFFKDVIKTRTEIRDKTITLPNDADIIIHFDMSGSFNDNSRNQIKDAINQWSANFANTNPDWTGKIYHSIQEGYESQRCWKVLRFIKTPGAIRRPNGTFVNTNDISKNVIAVSFVNENLIGGYNPHSCYHPQLSNPIGNGAGDFYDDYNDFVSLYLSHTANGGTFHALNYPINYDTNISYMTKGFVQHVLAAMKGTSYTQAEADAIIPNPFMSAGDWDLLKASLMGNNPYPNNGFENYGWKAISNRGWSGSGSVITPAQFQEDMNQFLQGIITIIQEEVQINYIEREYLYVEGEQQNIEDVIDYNASWTFSYSLEEKKWLSWHSYLPSFYINVPEKFYSWKHGNDSLWKHGKKGKYCNFYGVQYPWIIEYISQSNPTVTKIHDSISVILDAKKYQEDINEFYDVNDVFFNKMIAYNSRQCSGEMNLILKNQDENYLYQQVNNINNNEILVDRNERNWNINDFRDLRINYNVPIFKSDLKSVQDNYYIDKVLNTESINYNKNWTQLENFRDKYLAVRLIFDKFADTKMLLNFSLENETVSNR